MLTSRNVLWLTVALTIGTSSLAHALNACARLKLRAAGDAARDILRAHAVQAQEPAKTALAASLARTRERLERRCAKANRRGPCPSAVDAATLWQAATAFGDLVVSEVLPIPLAGRWTLTGKQTGGACSGDTPFFAADLTITQHGDSLAATSADGSHFYGSLTATGFVLYEVYGAVPCESGSYDVNRDVIGTLPPHNGQVTVTQLYGHYPLTGTCPPCGARWDGTMSRDPS